MLKAKYRYDSESEVGGECCSPVNQRQRVAHNATRKRAGNITSWELHRSVSVNSHKEQTLSILALFRFTNYLNVYIGVIRRCATCMMGMMGMFKWLRKDIAQRDRNRRTLSPKIDGLNNEAYRNAIHSFIERRKSPSDSAFIVAPDSPDKLRLDLLMKKNNENQSRRNNNSNNRKDSGEMLPGVPHASATDIFEIDCVAGTEGRYLELVYAEWHNTKVSLRRNLHPDCRNAIKADLDVLSDIRHPNVILLMGTTQTEEHGLVAIFEPVDCTLFNFIHEQGERLSIQGVAKCAGNLATALKHAHMRGWIHSAISPHCVYLASTGIVKLGGWELASNLNRPRIFREYEDRLRGEVFKWQAPELLTGHEASEACDVWGLALLMWEMCTMNVPWNNLTKAEVEKQYCHYRRGVITDLYNFPPLLNNLLEAGLQLDVNKRTLDMNKMSRYLQRLESQYEDEVPIYVEQSSNNNNNNINNKVATSPVCKSPVVIKHPETPRRQNVPHQAFQTCESYHDDYTQTEDLLEEVLKAASIQNATFITSTHSRATDVRAHPSNREIPPRRLRKSELTDEKRYSDPRVNIKKLKEILASKREKFFYGNAPNSEQYDPVKAQILSQIRSKDYEPHKPASHKTSLEPKMNKSPSQYGTYTKCSHVKSQKPYSYVPIPIRGAIIQPQVLNADSRSFFESSLWRKEKEICISKMRKESPDEDRPVTAIEAPKDEENNATYTINGEHDSEDGSQTLTADSVTETMTKSNSLQALRDALERATNIVRPADSSTTTPTDDSRESSSLGGSSNSFSLSETETLKTRESVFEELYRLNENVDEEIRSIELTPSGEIITFDSKISSSSGQNSVPVEESKKSKSDDEKDKDETMNSLMLDKTAKSITRTNFHCESIAENSFEENSGSEKRKEPEMLLHESIRIDNVHAPLVIPSLDSSVINDSDDNLSIFDDTNRYSYGSRPKVNLQRRRSLPAHLGQLRSSNSSPSGRQRRRRSKDRDSSTVDYYIDDEFQDESAVNIALLEQNYPIILNSDDFMPELIRQFENLGAELENQSFTQDSIPKDNSS